jgi:hypothetical protein
MAVPYSAASEKSEAAGSVSRDMTAPAEWTIYAVLFASASIVVGLVWDISWHRTIGRDTFWAPPHMLQQAGAIIAGLSCGYLALSTTFAGSAPDRAMSVRFWRFFQAPLGAWVCIWGTLMMITSAPFDNWWHNAYGLDVKIISPPHMILASGMIAVEIGAMMMALGAQNRAVAEEDRKRFGFMYAVGASVVVLMVCVILSENASYANDMHGSSFYTACGLAIPVFLVAFARASRLSWPATRIAIGYMLITMVAIWILELVPAQPKLAPIYNPVTRMVPPAFPLLLFVPAIAIDLALVRLKNLNDWFMSLLIGVSFVVIMVAVHWYWADFMMSPAARNFFFAADQWDYTNTLGPWRYHFWNLDVDGAGKWSVAAFASGLATAMVIATVSSRVGLAWGKGLSQVKR